MNILLTGFEPFGGSDVNPSQQAALDLDGVKIGSSVVVGRVLPVSWDRGIPTLVAVFNEVGPAAVVMCGQSGRPHISPEHVGINLRNGKDNNDRNVTDQPVVPGGPPAYFSTFGARDLARALVDSGIPARVSYTAGTYLCNNTLYGMLHHLWEEGKDIPAGFVHVPPLPVQATEQDTRALPSMSQDTINRALEVVIGSISRSF